MKWRVGGAVTQRSAKPFRRVRLSYVPPSEYETSEYRAFFLIFRAVLSTLEKSAVGNGLGQRIYDFLQLVDQTETLLTQ